MQIYLPHRFCGGYLAKLRGLCYTVFVIRIPPSEWLLCWYNKGDFDIMKEKILAYLNFDPKNKADKFMMKLYTWFNVSFGGFIILFGTLIHLNDFSWFNLLFIVFSVISNIIFFLFIRTAKNQLHEWYLYFFVSLCSVLTLLYGWNIFSSGEFDSYPRFTWIHMAGLIGSLLLSFYIILKFLWVLKLLKDNTIEEAKSIVRQKTPNSMGILIVGAPTALVFMVQGSLENLKQGPGLYIWLIMCVWLFFFLVISFRMFVICKYKVYEWFDESKNSKK